MSDTLTEAYPESSLNSDQPIPADQAHDNPLTIWRTFWPERNELRAYVSDWCVKSDANKKTIDNYWKRVDLAERSELGLDAARTVSSWRATKYAYVHVLSTLVMEAVKGADRADREKRYGDATHLIEEAIKDKARLNQIRNARLVNAGMKGSHVAV